MDAGRPALPAPAGERFTDADADVDLALAEFATLVASVVGLSSAVLLRPDGGRVVAASDRTPDLDGLPLPAGDTPVVVPDAGADPRTAALPAVLDGRIGAFVAVPVAVGEGPHGSAPGAVLVLHGPRPRPLPAPAVELVRRFAVLFGTGLEVARRYDGLAGDRQRWQLAVEAGGVGGFDWDLVTDRLDWDERLMELFGYGDGDVFVPHIDSFTARLHPEDVAPTEAIIAEAIAVSGRYRAEYRVVRPDGTVRWVAARGAVLPDSEGQPARMLGVAFDVSEAHQARSMVQRTRDRLALLAAVSSALADHRRPERVIGQLASVLSPRLADYCVVSLVGEDGRLRDVGSHHPDPESDAVLAAYSRGRLAASSPRAWVRRAVTTGRIVVVPYPASENIGRHLTDPELARHLDTLAPAFAICVPVRLRDEVLGVLTLFNDLQTGPFGPTDQQVAAEVAARVAVALVASRSFVRQRRIAEELQRTLLTAPPAVPPWQIAVRYAASVDDVQVGGDWYDAFPLPDGSLGVTVGDVMGHDSVAAARMAQLRSKLRGIFFALSPEPGRGLETVDAAMARFDLRTSATVVAARLRGADDGAVTMEWSLAGHPPPLVVGVGGARVLAAPVDPPLGVRAGLARRTATTRLAPGETLLCYTDGLVERRDEDIDVGIARLRALAEQVGPEPEALCDAVLTLRETRGGDDVAMIAVRWAPNP